MYLVRVRVVHLAGNASRLLLRLFKMSRSTVPVKGVPGSTSCFAASVQGVPVDGPCEGRRFTAGCAERRCAKLDR